MNADALLAALRANPDYPFARVLASIESGWTYTPTAFDNGLDDDRVHNAAGENAGSCKVFAWALLQGLNQDDTLSLFAEHYRQVLATPDGQDHANIRTFMRHGWDGIHFHGQALQPR